MVPCLTAQLFKFWHKFSNLYSKFLQKSLHTLFVRLTSSPTTKASAAGKVALEASFPRGRGLTSFRD